MRSPAATLMLLEFNAMLSAAAPRPSWPEYGRDGIGQAGDGSQHKSTDDDLGYRVVSPENGSALLHRGAGDDDDHECAQSCDDIFAGPSFGPDGFFEFDLLLEDGRGEPRCPPARQAKGDQHPSMGSEQRRIRSEHDQHQSQPYRQRYHSGRTSTQARPQRGRWRHRGRPLFGAVQCLPPLQLRGQVARPD